MNKATFNRNTPYNHLPLLPLDSDVLDKEVLIKWGLASRALAELKKNILRLPDPFMLVNTISIQEAKTSTEIENIFTTNDDLYKAISDKVREENADPATKEVLNYREALWAGYKDVITRGMFSIDSIVSIYQRIKNTRQGLRSPQSQVVIRRGDSDIKPGEIIYTPPRGKGVVEQKLNNLLEYLNGDLGAGEDPLIKMAITHYQFEAIHPFNDGNGRCGRVLNLLYLVKTGLLSHPVLYMSKYIIRNKADYYHLLAGVTQRGAWKPWLLFMLDAVEKTSADTNYLIDAIIDQMAATLLYARSEIKWYTKEVNELIFSQPYIKPSVIGKILGRTSRTTITNYMHTLSEMNILTPVQDGKEVFYLNNDLVRILEG
jgi:Fic family protein